jgi:Uma2 family endonuclease
MVTYPDVLVRCGEIEEDATEAADPMLIVEILSPSTRREDLIRKRYGYQAIPSLRWLIYVEPKTVQVEVVTRESDDTWRSVFVTDLGATVRIDELGVSLSLAELYEGLEAAK